MLVGKGEGGTFRRDEPPPIPCFVLWEGDIFVQFYRERNITGNTKVKIRNLHLPEDDCGAPGPPGKTSHPEP